MSGKSGHPPGLGPVFAYEWLTASRRWQGYVLRSLFVMLLLAALVVIWSDGRTVRAATSLRGLAQTGEQFYIAVIGTQLTLVLLAAPAATAGAICLDRARGSLAHLLVTDLSDREIVLGKLAARLVPVLGLIGCTLPVMAILTLLGGVDPDALLKAFVVTLGIASLGCCLALVFSLWVGKTHEALLGTYAVWGLWLLCAPMISLLNGTMGVNPVLPLETADPFALAFAPYWWPGRVGWGSYLGFLGVTGGLSAVLAIVAVRQLRPSATRQPVRRARPRPPHSGLRWAEVIRRLDWTRRLPGPTLDLNPVLWREWHRCRPSRWARIVDALFLSLAALFSILAILAGRNNVIAAWVNGLQVSIGLLLLSVTAATTLAEERVRGSLDVLMATPLSTREVVLGKWLGTFRRVLPLTILPVLVILLGDRIEVGRCVVAALMVVFMLCGGAAITSLGLALATWSSRLGRAVGLTVTLYVLVAVGWMFAMMALLGPGSLDGPMMGSPFFWAGELTFELNNNSSQGEATFAWAIFWIFAYASAAVALLVATLATFNHSLGRIETGLGPARPRVRKSFKPLMVEKAVRDSFEIA